MNKCIFCDSNNIRKFGKRNYLQLYHCIDCNKYFTKKSNPKRNLIINNEKYCNECNQFKNLSDFLYKKGKPRSICKSCFLLKNKSRYYHYKINENDFKVLLKEQDNKCAICNNEFNSNKKTFIDHNHDTGIVRELLCPKCNTLLGICNEDIKILLAAIIYIKKHSNK